MTLVESTSPNALLTASLDAARRQAAIRGEELLAETVDSLAELRDRIRAIPGLDVLDERHRRARRRPRLRPAPARGRRPRHRRHRPPDRAADARARTTSTSSSSPRTWSSPSSGSASAPRAPARAWSTALEHAVERLGEEEEEPLPPFAEPPPWGPTELSPREAFLAAQEVVAFDEAEGRIAAESLAAYPPGRPERAPRRAPHPRRRSTTSPTASPTAAWCAAPATAR